jgi:Tfp pilus assembly protein PilE
MPVPANACCTASPGARHASGFVLAEFLLALAVVSVLISIAAQNYGTVRRYILSEDQASRLVLLAADVHKMWRNASDYTTLTPQSLSQLDLIRMPMRWDGTTILDEWGNAMLVAGGKHTFAMTVGGGFNPMTPDECATVVNRLSSIALNINVGQSATLGTGFSAGKITGGLSYKNSALINQDSLTSGCSQVSPVVAAEFN